MAYLMRSSAGDWIDSHFRHQIRIFWQMLIGVPVVGIIFIVGTLRTAVGAESLGVWLFVLLGGTYSFMALVCVVYAWRVIRGWRALAHGNDI